MPSIARMVLAQVESDAVDEAIVSEADAGVDQNYMTQMC